MPREPRICYLCGTRIDSDLTADHVPPRLFVPHAWRQAQHHWIKLSAHRACNERYSQDEEYFRVSIAPAAHRTLGGAAIWRDVMHSAPKSRGLMLRVAGEISERTPGGLFAPNGWHYKRVDAPRIRRVMWKIARGLLFHMNGEIHSEDVRPGVVRLYPQDDFARLLENPGVALTVLQMPLRQVAPGAFSYRHLYGERDGTKLWALTLHFWDSYTGFINTHSSACQCTECSESPRT